jgi:hypothetical protein
MGRPAGNAAAATRIRIERRQKRMDNRTFMELAKGVFQKYGYDPGWIAKKGDHELYFMDTTIFNQEKLFGIATDIVKIESDYRESITEEMRRSV